MFNTINDGKLPTRGSRYSACVDLYANEDMIIRSGVTRLIPLGICLSQEHIAVLSESFLKSHYLQLMLRSSLSKELIIANGAGVIDLDYKDEIMIRVHNPIKTQMINPYPRSCYIDTYMKDVEIKKGQRVAQITMIEHKGRMFQIETDDERTGGFGSTDKCKVVL